MMPRMACFLLAACIHVLVHAQLPLLSSGEDSSKCTMDCSQERHRPLCGTDGRTYGSRCELQKAKCQGHLVEFKYRGTCPETVRCQAQRALAQAQARKIVMGIFVPDCKEDGSYSEVQCHSSTGYCWCVDESGKPVPGSSVRYKRPDCALPGCSNTDRSAFNANLIDIFKSEYKRIPTTSTTTTPSIGADPLLNTEEKRVIQWKFTQLDKNADNVLRRKEVRDLRRLVKKIVKPRPCAKTFAKYCDLDQDKKISRSEWSACLGVDINNEQVEGTEELHDTTTEDTKTGGSAASVIWSRQTQRLKTESRNIEHSNDGRDEDLQDCLATRLSAMDHHHQDPDGGIFIPECGPDGGYQEAQCHQSTGYCWCVNPKTGKPIRGTATHKVKPDCEGARKSAKSFKGKPDSESEPGELHHEASHFPKCYTRPSPIVYFPGCSLKKKQRFLEELLKAVAEELMTARNLSLSTSPKPTDEEAVRWKFATLDTNNNRMFDRREWKTFRKEWKAFRKISRGRKKLRKCWRNFPRYCDVNYDMKITQAEWFECTGVARDLKGNLPLNHKRRGPNPFSTILKSD